MNYTVWYKKGIFWHKVKNVEGDTILKDDVPNKGTSQLLPVRVLYLVDKSRIEIPMSCLIKFSKERFYDIKQKMEKESGQRI